MRRDKRALAGILDALIFLAIASLVAVSLLSACGHPSRSDDAVGERVDAAHAVLLRSTVLDAQGNSMTVEEAFKLGTLGPDVYENNVTMVLDLLLPGMEWRWSVERGADTWTYGDQEVPTGEVYCSLIRAPLDDAELIYRLDAWYL